MLGKQVPAPEVMALVGGDRGGIAVYCVTFVQVTSPPTQARTSNYSHIADMIVVVFQNISTGPSHPSPLLSPLMVSFILESDI